MALPAGDLRALTGAATIALQWDLTLTRDRVVEPQRKTYPGHAVVFHPHPDNLAEEGRAAGKASRAEIFEETIFSGIDAEPRDAFTAILAALRAQAWPGES